MLVRTCSQTTPVKYTSFQIFSVHMFFMYYNVQVSFDYNLLYRYHVNAYSLTLLC